MNVLLSGGFVQRDSQRAVFIAAEIDVAVDGAIEDGRGGNSFGQPDAERVEVVDMARVVAK